MKFPHDITIHPSIKNPETGQLTADGTPFTGKAFILFASSSETVSVAEHETGQRSDELLNAFLPPTTPPFDAFSEIEWTSSIPWQGGRFEVFGPPEPMGGTKGTVHHIQIRLRRVE